MTKNGIHETMKPPTTIASVFAALLSLISRICSWLCEPLLRFVDDWFERTNGLVRCCLAFKFRFDGDAKLEESDDDLEKPLSPARADFERCIRRWLNFLNFEASFCWCWPVGFRLFFSLLKVK